MTRRLLRILIMLVIIGETSVLSAQPPLRYPDVGGGQTRVEVHLLPATSTGPLDPAWSPDGKWIAFSMRGDIWKIPAAGGKAIALTKAPGYHFEPSWSPDGNRLSLTVDLDGNLDIATVSALGGEIIRLTTDTHVDVQSVWSRDGKGIYFVSARNGSFDIFYKAMDSAEIRTVVGGRGHQIQPVPSPDDAQLAYISPVRGKLGSGGIWVKSLPDGEPRLVHYEETSYRAKPAWTPDGAQIVFVSDEAGSNDIAVIPASGGSKARLTESVSDEYSPVVDGTGTRVAFVANSQGATDLYTMPVGGSRRQAWTKVSTRDRVPLSPTGLASVKILGPDGTRSPARIYLTAGDGRAYAPDGAFHRVISATETHYFHTDGDFIVEVPAGKMTIEAMRGYEYTPVSKEVMVTAGRTTEVVLKLQRLVDLPSMGWYSGETHSHDLHQGRFGLTQQSYYEQLVSEDLHVTNTLIHMDGTRLMGRWDDLTGRPHPLSTTEHILQYAQEFRGAMGHIGLLGIREFVMPLISGTAGTAFASDALNYAYIDAARAQGGIAGFMHPYNGKVTQPRDAAGSEIVLDVALGKGDFYDILCVPYDDLGNAEMYYRILNAGIRLPATGGSDSFADAWRDPPPGTTRTFAKIDGPLSVQSWLNAVRAGRTFGSSGPLLFMNVNGKEPGAELRLDADTAADLQVDLKIFSIVPVDRVEIIVNGEIVKRFGIASKTSEWTVSETIRLESSGWIAARAIGPSGKYVGDSYAFAHTSPVYIVRNGKKFVSAEAALFLDQVVAELWKRVEARNLWTSEAQKSAYFEAVNKARGVYQKLANPPRGS